MRTIITPKLAQTLLIATTTHPFEAGVRKDISELRGQLTALRTAASQDPFAKNQLRNLEAQLGKKNAYLASLTAGQAKPVLAQPTEKRAPARIAAPAPAVAPTEPQQAFGALGARLKGRLAPEIAAKLAPPALDMHEGF